MKSSTKEGLIKGCARRRAITFVDFPEITRQQDGQIILPTSFTSVRSIVIPQHHSFLISEQQGTNNKLSHNNISTPKLTKIETEWALRTINHTDAIIIKHQWWIANACDRTLRTRSTWTKFKHPRGNFYQARPQAIFVSETIPRIKILLTQQLGLRF